MSGFTAEALVPTALPRRFMAQLCKHFQHKLAVVLNNGKRRGGDIWRVAVAP